MTDLTYWHKQTADRPLFPDLLWSRPENRRQAGKLLIIGGNAHGFAASAAAFAAAQATGAGSVRVLLPDSLQKTVGRGFPAAEFAPSTPSGSFGQRALALWLDAAEWADAVMLAGNFGNNSETAIVLEKFAQKYKGSLVLSQDAIHYFTSDTTAVVKRTRTLLVTEFTQLQKLARQARVPYAFTSDMDLLRLIEQLHNFTEQHPAGVMVEHLGNIVVAVNGQVSTTKNSFNPIKAAARAAVWWLQNPKNPFAALTTSIVEG